MHFLGKTMLLALVTMFAFEVSASAMPTWERPVEQPAAPGKITALAPNPAEPSLLLAASASEILGGTKEGTWKSFGRPGNGDAAILDMAAFPALPGKLFALTENGAYFGNLDSGEWSEAFAKKWSRSARVLSFSILPEDPDYWLAGTDQGLFESDDQGATWHRFENFSDREPVRKIHFENDRFWVITSSRVYVTDTLSSFRCVFSLRSPEGKDSDESISDFSESSTASAPEIMAAEFSDHAPFRIWLGTSDGVFEYDIEKMSSRRLPLSGLKNHTIRYLVWAKKTQLLAAGTSSGIFIFDAARGLWRELYQGLSSTDVKSLCLISGNSESLAAVTGDGVLTFPLGADLEMAPRGETPFPETAELLQLILRVEPSARDIQKAVIKAANVSPGKTRRWHAESRLRAFFPTVSFGRDVSRGNNVDIDRGGTSDPDRYIAGPDQLDSGWDLGVSWDLGDFIWSSNQTSIDSRDKLMTELRNDLLAEATRLYYERRRLQMELAYAKAQDVRTFYENRLRLEELTSLLDGLTNGYLSQALNQGRRDHPQLQKLEDPPVQTQMTAS